MDVNLTSVEILDALSQKIKLFIERKEVSRREIARISTIAESTVRSLINGRTNIELSTLTKLKLAFNIEVIDLIIRKTKLSDLSSVVIEKGLLKKDIIQEQKKLGDRLDELREFRGIDPQTLSIISYNIDYSDTIKYLKGKKNISLITIIKLANGLEVDLATIFNYDGKMPSNKFVGNVKK